MDGEPSTEAWLDELMTWQNKPQYIFILDPTDAEILDRSANSKADPLNGQIYNRSMLEVGSCSLVILLVCGFLYVF